MNSSTFPDLLAGLLRSDASRPLVTYYDDASGERVELSVATYANWVAKTAGLAQDELDLERGGLVLLDLPTHWLGAVWLGAAWTLGGCVTTDTELADDCDVIVTGPAGLDRHASLAEGRPVVGISLRPLGGRFTEAVPDGVVDYGAVVLAHPDVFVAHEPPTADDTAWRDRAGSVSQQSLWAACEQQPLVESGGRLLTDVNPASSSGLSTLVSPLLREGGTVWVANPDQSVPGSWQHRYDAERATAQLRA